MRGLFWVEVLVVWVGSSASERLFDTVYVWSVLAGWAG